MSGHWLTGIGAASVLFMASTSFGVVIGDFEGGVAETGWGEWTGSITPFSANITVSSEQATSGSYSAKINIAGWDQSLAYNAGAAGTIAAFMANNTLEFDITFAASGSAGWAKLEGITLNSQFGGWTSIGGTQLAGWGDGGGAAQTFHFALDYSTIQQSWLNNGTPGWVEVIFTTNDDGSHPVKYIDNVQLTPEPASIALMGIGGLMMFRRRIRA